MDLQHDIYDFLRDEELYDMEEHIVSLHKYMMSHSGSSEFDSKSLLQHLIEERKWKIDRAVRDRQELLYDDIDACNRRLYWAVREAYNKAHEIWNKIPLLHREFRVELTAYLGGYPELHPVQDKLRVDLWRALTEERVLNPLYYDDGITLVPIEVSRRENEPFDYVVGMQKQFRYSWNEGFDRELTDPLHLNMSFHHLYDHTELAITDFLYVQDFRLSIKIEDGYEVMDDFEIKLSDEDLAKAYL